MWMTGMLAALASCAALVPGAICPIEPRGSLDFSFALQEGELFAARIQTLGADLETSITDPDGRELWRGDGRLANDGFEAAQVLAPRAGIFRLTVRSKSDRAGALCWDRIRRVPADADDPADTESRRRAGPEAELAQFEAGLPQARLDELGERLEQARAMSNRFAGLALADLEARSRIAEVDLLRRLHRDGDLPDRLASAERSARSAGDGQLIAATLWRRGDFEMRTGELERARRTLAEGLAFGGVDRLVEMHVRTSLGVTLYRLGRNDEAAAEHRRSAELAAELDLPYDQAAAILNASAVDVARSEFDSALAGFLEASRRLAGLGRDAERALALSNAGVVMRRLGDEIAARALFEQALAAEKGLLDPARRSSLVLNLATTLESGGDKVAAEGRYREALDLARAANSDSRIAAAEQDLAMLLSEVGEANEAATLLADALERARTSGEPDRIISVLTGSGEVALRRGDFEAARRVLDEALDLALAYELPDREIGARTQRARLAMAAEDSVAGLAEVRAAVERAELVRAELPDPGSRAGYMARVRALYDIEAALDLQRGAQNPTKRAQYDEAAFECRGARSGPRPVGAARSLQLSCRLSTGVATRRNSARAARGAGATTRPRRARRSGGARPLALEARGGQLRASISSAGRSAAVARCKWVSLLVWRKFAEPSRRGRSI